MVLVIDGLLKWFRRKPAEPAPPAPAVFRFDRASPAKPKPERSARQTLFEQPAPAPVVTPTQEADGYQWLKWPGDKKPEVGGQQSETAGVRPEPAKSRWQVAQESPIDVSGESVPTLRRGMISLTGSMSGICSRVFVTGWWGGDSTGPR